MSGPIVRTGTTPAFWRNWEKVFGKKSGNKSGKSAPRSKKAKPAKSKKAVKAKKTAKKKAGRKKSRR